MYGLEVSAFEHRDYVHNIEYKVILITFPRQYKGNPCFVPGDETGKVGRLPDEVRHRDLAFEHRPRLLGRQEHVGMDDDGLNALWHRIEPLRLGGMTPSRRRY